MNTFYVYAYCDPRKPSDFSSGFEPFYIGKGTKNRMFHHLQNRKNKNTAFTNKIKKIKSLGLEPIIIKVKDNLDETTAFALEKNLIKIFGMFPDGSLCNMSEGGSGGRPSEEAIEKIRNSLKGKPLQEETKKKISDALTGKNRNIETKRKISNSLKGQKHTDQRRANISAKRNEHSKQLSNLKIYTVLYLGIPFVTIFGIHSIGALGFSPISNSLNTKKPISRGEFKGWQIIKE